MRSDSAATLERLVARAGQLYSLPIVAMQVLQLTNSPQVDNRAIKECIENDPALTGKILRVVNSSLFGLSREVSDLNQAIALLGSKPLKLLVLGFSLPNNLFASVESEILMHYWRRALTKAVAGREISETLWNLPGDEAFIAGLLQDLGLLLLIQQVGEPYALLLKKVWSEGKDMAALEAESMGFDHTELSTKLLSQWGLPEALVEAVGWDPARRTASGLT
jgi:HD-like signal output (HDOD) protein